MKKKYLVVFEAGPTSFGAQSPDIPGCFSVGDTLEQARKNFVEAAEGHLAWMAEDGDPIPEPHSTSFEFGPDEPGDQTTAFMIERIAITTPEAVPHAQVA